MLVHENDFVRFAFAPPLLHVTVRTNRAPTDDEWDFTKRTMVSFYTSAIQSGTRFAILFDLCQMGMLPLSRFIDWSQLFLAHRASTEKCVICTALVTDSDVLRVAVNGFFTLYNPVRPLQFVKSVAEGEAWIGGVSEGSVTDV